MPEPFSYMRTASYEQISYAKIMMPSWNEPKLVFERYFRNKIEWLSFWLYHISLRKNNANFVRQKSFHWIFTYMPKIIPRDIYIYALGRILLCKFDSAVIVKIDNIKYNEKVKLSTYWYIKRLISKYTFSCDFSGVLETKVCLACPPLGLYGISGEIWWN